MGVLTFFESHKNFCRPKAPIIESLHFHILSLSQDGEWGKWNFLNLLSETACGAPILPYIPFILPYIPYSPLHTSLFSPTSQNGLGWGRQLQWHMFDMYSSTYSYSTFTVLIFHKIISSCEIPCYCYRKEYP